MPRLAGAEGGLCEVFFLRLALAGAADGPREVFFLRLVLAGAADGLREVFFFFLRAVVAGADRFDLPVRFGAGLVFLIRRSLSRCS
jgi:hypothetical protein